MIRIEDLTILFHSFQITNFNINIEAGNFHFLLGPTGSGKTLILESIMGLHNPKKGRIWVGEREVQDLPPEQREISYVPQDLALFPHLTVKQNVLFGIRARNLDLTLYEKYVQNLIEVTKVSHLLERYPNNLSGGEKKRVALLRALAPQPKLLLLDEPLSGLDPSIKSEIQYLLKTLQGSIHPTTLYVTHDFEEAYLLGDTITIVINGRVEQVGKRDDIFLRPESQKVAQFLGARNLYRAVILGKDEDHQRWLLGVNGLQFSIPFGQCKHPLELGKEVDLFIRPEEVMILREGKPVKESLRRNMFEGEILDIANRERFQVVTFQTRKGNIFFEVSIPNYAFRNLGVSVGKVVRVALREESLWVMG
ncbi:MAG TPA: ABC transporter ATP-binding protein [Thermodesulfobacteriota bacterium]|nr:ABC transporter ATP-binding protein [Thermodesulfobacteriota bacterium]